MDLIEYLSSKKDRDGKPIIRKRKRGRRKIGRPRRARGYGQRSSKYNSSNRESFDNNIDMRLASILAAISKLQTPIINPETLTQSKTYTPLGAKVGQKEFLGSNMLRPDLYTMEEGKVRKAITLPTQTEDPNKIEKQKAIIFNATQDLDSKIQEILEKQEDLEVAISREVDFGEGKELGERSGQPSNLPLTYEAAQHLREENLKLKEEVLSETLKVQEMLNDAEDLNDYKDLLQKQNKLIDLTTKGFVKIDGYIDKENKRTFDEINEKLQKSEKAFGENLESVVEEVSSRIDEKSGAITKKLGQEIFMKKRLKTYEKEMGGLIEGISQSKLEKQGLLGQEIVGNVRERIQQEKVGQGAIRAIEGQGQIIRELSSELKEMSEFNRELQEDKQIGILGVLGQEVLGNVRQDIATKKQKKLKGRLKDTQKFYEGQEMELIDMREQAITDLELQGKMVKNITDLRNIVKGQQTTGRLQGIREGALAGVRERLTQKELQEKNKELHQKKLEALFSRNKLQEAQATAEQRFKTQTRLAGDVERLAGEVAKKEQKIEKMSGLLKEEMGEKMKFMVKAKEALEKAEKEAAKRDITKQQLEGMKSYVDKLNDELLASGAKGLTAQQQFYQKQIQDRDIVNEELKLKLERSEAKEKKLRDELAEVEDYIDIEAELELQRVLSET